MPFVLDASVTASWAFPDEVDPIASAALERLRADDALVPSLWWFEIRNTLIVNERRKRITVVAVDVFLAELASLGIAIDSEPDGERVMAIARKYNLSAYDSAYLELAERAKSPLASLDGSLVKAAKAQKIALIE